MGSPGLMALRALRRPSTEITFSPLIERITSPVVNGTSPVASAERATTSTPRGIAQVGDFRGNLLVNCNAEDAERTNQTFLRIGERSKLIDFAGLFNHGHIEGEPLRAAKNFQMHFSARFVQHKMQSEIRNVVHRPAVHRDHNIFNVQACSLRRAAGFYVGNHHSGILAQIQSGGQRGRDRLNIHSNFAAIRPVRRSCS